MLWMKSSLSSFHTFLFTNIKLIHKLIHFLIKSMNDTKGEEHQTKTLANQEVRTVRKGTS
jgi:hypothetical protein